MVLITSELVEEGCMHATSDLWVLSLDFPLYSSFKIKEEIEQGLPNPSRHEQVYPSRGSAMLVASGRRSNFGFRLRGVAIGPENIQSLPVNHGQVEEMIHLLKNIDPVTYQRYFSLWSPKRHGLV